MSLEEHLCEGQQPRIQHCWGISCSPTVTSPPTPCAKTNLLLNH